MILDVMYLTKTVFLKHLKPVIERAPKSYLMRVLFSFSSGRLGQCAGRVSVQDGSVMCAVGRNRFRVDVRYVQTDAGGMERSSDGCFIAKKAFKQSTSSLEPN